MTMLSRLAKLGGAKETTPYTYLAPTFSIPFNSGTKFSDVILPLRDESMRANDVVLQGLNQGPAHAEWDIAMNGYADICGNFFRAMIGPDTVTAGTATTLAANTSAGATTFTTTAALPAGANIVQINDAAGANLEWASVTATGTACTVVAGGGPGGNSLKFAHTAAGGAVSSQSTHLFKQNRTFNTVWPTYSLTTDEGVDQLGWTGCVMSELDVKIDPKGFVTFSVKYMGMPSTAESTFAYAASAIQPVVGWAWTVTNDLAASTRGLTMDFVMKRAVEAIQSSDGLQAPREIFPGALEVDGSYKAIFENDLDISLFKTYNQYPTVHTLTQPPASGGASLVITMSESGYTTGEKDLGSAYVQLSQSLSGIANTTDAGVVQVTLKNFQSASY